MSQQAPRHPISTEDKAAIGRIIAGLPLEGPDGSQAEELLHAYQKLLDAAAYLKACLGNTAPNPSIEDALDTIIEVAASVRQEIVDRELSRPEHFQVQFF